MCYVCMKYMYHICIDVSNRLKTNLPSLPKSLFCSKCTMVKNKLITLLIYNKLII